MDTIVRNNSARLSVSFADGDTPVAADGAVSVAVTDDTGASVASGSASADATVGTYYFDLAPRADLGRLTLTWSGTFGGLEQTVTTDAEVVGGMLLSLTECRSADKVLADTTRYPAAAVLAARQDVLAEFERILNFGLVGRAARAELDGVNRPWLTLPSVYVTRVTGVTIVTGTNTWAGDAAPGMTTQVWTPAQLADLTVSYTGRIARRDGTAFPAGSGNVQVAYEHGFAFVPDDLKRAAKRRLASILCSSSSGIPDRATSFVASEGGNFTLATPGRNGSFTGIPDVDAVLARYVVPRGIA